MMWGADSRTMGRKDARSNRVALEAGSMSWIQGFALTVRLSTLPKCVLPPDRDEGVTRWSRGEVFRFGFFCL